MKTGSRSGYGAGHSGSDVPPHSAAEYPRRAEPDAAERLAALSALVDSLSQQIEVIEGASTHPQRATAPVAKTAPSTREPDPNAALEGRFDALGRQLDDRQSDRLSGIETRLAAIASQLAAAKSNSAPTAAPAPARPAKTASTETLARPRAEQLSSLQAAIAEISSRQRAIDLETSAPANHFDAIAIEDAIAALRDDIALLGRRVSAEARRTDESSQTLKSELAARIEALASSRAPASDVLGLLRHDLAEIRQSLDLAARETTLASIESGYGHIIERLDDIVRRAPETDRFDRLTHEIAQLASSIETNAPSREVETELEDIRNAVASLSISRSDAVSAAVERQISSLHAAIDTLASRPAPAIDLSGIEREIDALRRDMDGFSRGADPLALIRLEKQIAGIRATIDDIDPRPAGLDSTALSRLEDRIDALAGRFDALAELPTLRAPAAPDALDGLRSEITQLREDFARPPRFDAIEEQMQALVRRLDATTRNDDSQALAQLEAQVGALAEQFSAAPGTAALARVEENLDRLQSLLGNTRHDTIDAARDAARSTFREFADTLPARSDDTLIQALREDMRQLQEAADRSGRQTHDTLEACARHACQGRQPHRAAGNRRSAVQCLGSNACAGTARNPRDSVFAPRRPARSRPPVAARLRPACAAALRPARCEHRPHADIGRDAIFPIVPDRRP
jgi:localization factor PodJL